MSRATRPKLRARPANRLARRQRAELRMRSSAERPCPANPGLAPPRRDRTYRVADGARSLLHRLLRGRSRRAGGIRGLRHQRRLGPAAVHRPLPAVQRPGPRYQRLHRQILDYLLFLRDRAAEQDLDPKLIDAWYRFKEVKQNWLGFTLFGNDGAGLGKDFAQALHSAPGEIFADFGNETATRGTHVEKLCLIRDGVGRDNISDFTTNLIKGFLCEYTQAFARQHIEPEYCQEFAVRRARFNYDTRTWAMETYYLPRLGDDFVLLTPMDMLTRDDTWINHGDMISKFWRLPEAVSDAELRASINQYFERVLGQNPTAKQKRQAAAATIKRFPELIDLYIKLQEDDGDRAEAVSAEKVRDTQRALVEQIREALAGISQTEFFDKPWRSYAECLARARYFRVYIEDNDGYLLFNRAGRPFSNEKELQLAFGLVWCGTEFDVNREVNNGRGPVDFKVSFGAGTSR
jgi:hypothetical protein